MPVAQHLHFLTYFLYSYLKVEFDSGQSYEQTRLTLLYIFFYNKFIYRILLEGNFSWQGEYTWIKSGPETSYLVIIFIKLLLFKSIYIPMS